MRKTTENIKKLKRMYTIDNGRLQGEGPWSKLPFFWFTLFLSYQCTRRCEYCYSFNQMENGSKFEMDDATFARLLDWIPEVWRVNGVKVNYIGFLGGEPLMHTGRIRQVMESAYRNTDGMQGSLNTNGDLIDTVNWDDLADIQWMTINITDLSLDELARRMKIIVERSNVINQTITATMDDFNLGRVLDITRFGIENGYRLRFQKNIYKATDEEYNQRILRKYHEVCDLLEDYVHKGYHVHTTFLLDALIPDWDREYSPYPCGKRLAVVYPDGSVGPCIRDHSFTTGTIFDPDPMKAIESETFQYSLDREYLPGECNVCESRNACQGGCPHDKLLTTGTACCKSVTCGLHREIIPRLKRLEELKKGA